MNIKRQSSDYWEIVQLSTQGRRPSMEDSSVFLYPFTTSDTSLFLSVFDGHVGPRCAQFLSTTLPLELRKEAQSSNLTIPSEDLLMKVFSETDQLWLESAKSPRIQDGSTALCVAIDNNELIVANCGDCRAIIHQAGETQALTRDHRPTDKDEEKRIVLQGGAVIGGRLQGQLGVSRAFGNYDFKESNILSSEPEIHQFPLTPEVELLVVGSDGLNEHFNNNDVINFIKTGLAKEMSLETVVKELVEEAVDRGSEDNITIIVVKFEKTFKKLLKKKVKKQASGRSSPSSILPSGKSSPLRTSGKTPKHPPPESSPGLFRKLNNLKTTTSKSSLGPVTNASTITEISSTSVSVPSSQSGMGITTKKRSESKKIKQVYDEEKWNIFSKSFKYDFFSSSRTPVAISG